ncbi:MAG: type II toxin-antitoxin system antitoxin SocA domain-containing protein [Aquisalimonadaceae bacterium]
MANTTAQSVATYLLWFSNEHGDLLTNLKLQKLVYYAQAWYLALERESLFDDEIQAWVHGPVIPAVYRAYRDFKWSPILVEVDKPNLPPKIEEHLADVMAEYGGFSAYDLERMTHSELPWLEARGGIPADESSNAPISQDTMAHFYRKCAEASN